MNILPLELLHKILSYSSANDIVTYRGISRLFRSIANSIIKANSRLYHKFIQIHKINVLESFYRMGELIKTNTIQSIHIDPDLIDQFIEIQPVIDGVHRTYPLLTYLCLHGNKIVDSTTYVKKLIKAGADINLVDEDGTSPLLIAIMSCNEEIAKILVDNGAYINLDNYIEGITEAIESMNGTYEQTIQLFVDVGGDLDFTNECGTNFMSNAIIKDRPDLVKILIEKGANVDTQDDAGRTALMDAVALKRYDIAKLLIDAGADINLINYEGKTALQLIDNWELAELLIRHSNPS